MSGEEKKAYDATYGLLDAALLAYKSSCADFDESCARFDEAWSTLSAACRSFDTNPGYEETLTFLKKEAEREKRRRKLWSKQ